MGLSRKRVEVSDWITFFVSTWENLQIFWERDLKFSMCCLWFMVLFIELLYYNWVYIRFWYLFGAGGSLCCSCVAEHCAISATQRAWGLVAVVRCVVARVSGDSFLRRAGVFVLYMNFCALSTLDMFKSEKSRIITLNNILGVNLRELLNFWVCWKWVKFKVFFHVLLMI